jgi:hypothetical protein
MVGVLLASIAAAIVSAGPTHEVAVAAVLASQSPIEIERTLGATMSAEKQWAAFRPLAAPEALLFVQPLPAGAPQPDKGSVNLTSIAQPREEITSCDSSLVVTNGALNWSNGGHGRYTTVWQRDTKGGWKWLLHARFEMTAPLKVSPLSVPLPTCPTTAPAAIASIPAQRGGSIDNSLRWFYLAPNNGHGGLAINAWVRRGFLAIQNESLAVPPSKP